MVKHYPPPFNLARKAYFEFDLSGLNADFNTQAVFTVQFQANFKHRVQLWGLDQPYPAFNENITWNTAQANETNSNDLLTIGPLTGTQVGASVFIPVTGTTPYAFTIPRLGDFVFDNRLVLVLSGVDDANNNAGGLRILRTNSTLQVLAFAPPLTNEVHGIARSNGAVLLEFLGNAGRTYLVQAVTNVPSTNWITIGTNVASETGAWTFTDPHAANYPNRFYRSVAP
jgi:hypothetical protein